MLTLVTYAEPGLARAVIVTATVCITIHVHPSDAAVTLEEWRLRAEPVYTVMVTAEEETMIFRLVVCIGIHFFRAYFYRGSSREKVCPFPINDNP